jgi:hypothetical protein
MENIVHRYIRYIYLKDDYDGRRREGCRKKAAIEVE